MALQSLVQLLHDLPLPPPQRSAALAARVFGGSAIICLEGYGRFAMTETTVKLEGDAARLFDAITDLYPLGVVAIDTASDPRIRDCRPPTDAIRFVAGAPLLSSGDLPIGALWIVDREPRNGFSSDDMANLKGLASVISLSMELPLLATEAFEAELTVKASEARFRLLADCAPVLIWQVGPDGAVLFLNKALRDYHGITPADVDGFDWTKQMHPDDRSALGDFFAAFNQRSPCHQEARIRRADGEYRWLAIHARPAHREDGHFTGFVGVMTDISEHKRKEDLLTQNILRLAQIFESSYDAIMALDMEGRITTWNAAAERLFGYSAAEAGGQHYTLLAPPGAGADMEELFARCERGDTEQQYDALRRHKDGSTVAVSVRLSPIRNRQGMIEGMSAIYRATVPVAAGGSALTARSG